MDEESEEKIVQEYIKAIKHFKGEGIRGETLIRILDDVRDKEGVDPQFKDFALLISEIMGPNITLEKYGGNLVSKYHLLYNTIAGTYTMKRLFVRDPRCSSSVLMHDSDNCW